MPKKRMYKRRKRVSNKLSARVSKLESMLSKTVENKVSDINSGGTPIGFSTTPYTQLAFARGLSTGADANERVGNKMTLMSQSWNITIRAPSGALDEQQNQVRLLLVENVGFTGTTDLALTDVLQFGDFPTYGTQVFISPYRTNANDSTKRYKILFDKVMSFSKTDKGYRFLRYKKRYGTKKSPGKVLTFDSPVDAFPNNHRVVLFAISDSSVTAHPDITWNCRNIYKDA